MIKLFESLNISRDNKDINNIKIENDEYNEEWFEILLKR